MSNSFHHGSWRLYLNGIETPAETISIQTGTFAFPTASITLAPDKELLRLGSEDRLQVAVFYLDVHATAQEQAVPDYRLLFEGEVVSWGYQNTASGRAISFQAVSHAAILTRIRPFLMSSVNQFAQHVSNDPNTAGIMKQRIADLFYTGLDRTSDKFILRPYDFIENIFRMLFGQGRLDKEAVLTSSAGAHFFARWARRTNFINRWAPSPYIEIEDRKKATDGVFPILQAVRDEKILELVMQSVTELGGSESMWSLITYLFQHMYYEMTLIPNMPVVSYDLKEGKVLGKPEYAFYSSSVNAAATRMTDMRKLLAGRRSDAEIDSMKQRLSVLQAQDTLDDNARAEVAQLKSSITNHVSDADVAGYEADLKILEQAYTTAKSEAQAGYRGRGPGDPMKPIRILNYVTKPQLQFCAVPRCNIILPSMVTDYSFNEDYSAQPTRLYVSDAMWDNVLAGGTESIAVQLGLTRVGYPKQVRNFLQKTSVNRALSDKNFLIFPEEYYKGPVIESIRTPGWFSAFAIATSTRIGKTDGSYNKDAAIKALGNLLDIYSEYEYHKIRGMMRTGTVAMCFNPYVVPGFPAVVLDEERTNVHVFCYVQNVTHVLSSSGMSTTMNYSFAQTFDEFFDTYAKQLLSSESATTANSYTEAKTQYSDALKAFSSAKDAATLRIVEDAREKLRSVASSGLTQVYGAASVQEADLSYIEEVLRAADDAEVARLKSQYPDAAARVSLLDRALATPDMVPAHPVPDVRVRFQNIDNAQEYYADLFQQGNASKQAVFDWRSMIGVLDPARPTVPPTPITFAKQDTVQTSKTSSSGKVYVTEEKQLTTDATRGVYGLREPYRALLTSTEAAMRYVSRPIVTLDEYIDFHGDMGIRDGVEYEDGLKYYAKIMDYSQGPGEDPGQDEYGYPNTAVLEDTRKDWESRLLNYRNKMRSKFFFRS